MHMRLISSSLVVLLALGLQACHREPPQTGDDRYPWQVISLGDGSSRVFGVQLGVTRLSESRQLLGEAPELALFENPDGRLSLEMFYKEFTRAGLSARLVLTVRATQDGLAGLKSSARQREQLESGTIQYRLDEAGLGQAGDWPISAMTYMPYADLEEQTLLARFGEPAERIRSHEKAVHWLYPEKGLDVIVNEVGKEVLQYVPPTEFEHLTAPLRGK